MPHVHQSTPMIYIDWVFDLILEGWGVMLPWMLILHNAGLMGQWFIKVGLKVYPVKYNMIGPEAVSYGWDLPFDITLIISTYVGFFVIKSLQRIKKPALFSAESCTVIGIHSLIKACEIWLYQLSLKQVCSCSCQNDWLLIFQHSQETICSWRSSWMSTTRWG